MASFDRVREIIADQLGIAEEEIALESSLTSDLGVDSLDMMELVLSLEEEFDLEEISETEWERWHAVAQLVDFLDKRTH